MGSGHVLISSMKNEGPFVLEWVAHHLVLGFDRILVASNDCEDGTDAILAALAAGGAIGHAPNVVAPGEAPQHSGYALMRRQFGLNKADWLMVLDADEFLQVRVGQGLVQDLTAQAGADIDVIALNALTFGTAAGGWHPGRVCARFRQRLPDAHRTNGMVKSITRGPGRFRAIHNHSMVGFRSEDPLRVMLADGSVLEVPKGEKIWKRLRHFAPQQIRHEMACFNHYAVKTRDSFELRRKRGRGTTSEENLRHSQAYFSAIAGAQMFDATIDVYTARVTDEMTRLMALPGVAEAQARTEALYGAMIRALAAG